MLFAETDLGEAAHGNTKGVAFTFWRSSLAQAIFVRCRICAPLHAHIHILDPEVAARCNDRKNITGT